VIELADNVVQLVVLAISFGLSILRFARTLDRAWFSLVGFFGCDLLAMTYWVAYLAIYDVTPRFYISDLGWISCYLFMIMLELASDAWRTPQPPVPQAWLPVVLVVPNFVLYIQRGDLLNNIVCCALMAAIGYLAVRGMAARPGRGFARNPAFHGAVLIWVTCIVSVWTTSCFWGYAGDAITPYTVADFCATLSYVGILACAWRTDAI
jgi:hypothetical protein